MAEVVVSECAKVYQVCKALCKMEGWAWQRLWGCILLGAGMWGDRSLTVLGFGSGSGAENSSAPTRAGCPGTGQNATLCLNAAEATRRFIPANAHG